MSPKRSRWPKSAIRKGAGNSTLSSFPLMEVNMTELWGVICVLTLACVVFGYVIVDLSRRVDRLEAHNRKLLDQMIAISSNGKDLAESVLALTRMVRP